METPPYLDIHTHIRDNHPESVNVASLSVEEILSEKTPKDYATAGIHPWWLEDYTQEEIESLKTHVLNLLNRERLWGIGETGLDRAVPETLDAQRSLFQWHRELAEKNGLPLIIHSVRAGADFLQILKEEKPQSPWIFHDFRGNETLLNDLLRLHPRCYFSFGMSIDNSPQVRELLPLVPVEHLFLETDDQKHLDIHDIYLRAAGQVHFDTGFLKSQIWHNFKKITPLVQ